VTGRREVGHTPFVRSERLDAAGRDSPGPRPRREQLVVCTRGNAVGAGAERQLRRAPQRVARFGRATPEPQRNAQVEQRPRKLQWLPAFASVW
jgi:hypothetical protein